LKRASNWTNIPDEGEYSNSEEDDKPFIYINKNKNKRKSKIIYLFINYTKYFPHSLT